MRKKTREFNMNDTNMKSPYKLSQELSISSTAVYKKIKQLENELEPYIKKKNGKILLSDEAERILRNSFSEVIQPVSEQFDKQLDNQLDRLDSRLYNQLNTENEYLREQNKTLLEKVGQQSNQIAELAEKLVELTRNSQVLLKQEQDKSTLLLPEQTKRPFWQFWKK